MTNYLAGLTDERSRIVNLLVCLIEDVEIRDWYFGNSCDEFFANFGYDLIEIIENEQ